MDGFRWLFKLDGDVSGAQKVRAELEGMRSDLKGLKSEGGSASMNLASSLKELGGKALFLGFTFNQVAEAARTVWDIFKGVTETVFGTGLAFAKATVGSASFAENTKIAFETILGSGKAADDFSVTSGRTTTW